MAEGTEATPAAGDLPGVRANGPLADLHLSIDGRRVELWCTEPPSRLQLLAPALRDAGTLALNGREHRIEHRSASSITILGADWGPAEPEPRPRTLRTHVQDRLEGALDVAAAVAADARQTTCAE